MDQLLKITTVPIKYEIHVEQAKIEKRNATAELEISRDKGGLQIKSRPIKVNIDTSAARNSVVPTTKVSISDAATKGRQAAMEATANYAQESRMMFKTKNGQGGETLQHIFEQRAAMPTGEFQLAFIPKQGADLSWEGPGISIEYQMDKLNFDLQVDQGNIEFTPGSVEVSITQNPSVSIEYVGQPIYVPASVAERFTGKKVDVTV